MLLLEYKTGKILLCRVGTVCTQVWNNARLRKSEGQSGDRITLM